MSYLSLNPFTLLSYIIVLNIFSTYVDSQITQCYDVLSDFETQFR